MALPSHISSTQSAATPLPARTVRIGLQASSIDPFWVEVRETIWHACQRDDIVSYHPSYAPPYAVDLIEIETLPGDLEGDEFATRVEAMLALELDALIAVPASMRFIEALLENGLPVIALHHRDFAHPLFSCLPELYPSARLVCQYLLHRLNESGRVLIVGGQQGYVRSAPSSRLQAALDLFAHSPAIQWQRVPAPWDYAGALAALQEALTSNDRPFDGIFGLSDTLALAGREVCLRLGLLDANGIVVGINGDPLAIAAIANGEMAATVATAATEIGGEALRIACLAASGAPIPPKFDYHPKLVTAENVAQAALQRLVHISDLPSRLVGANLRQEEQRVADLETSLAINHRIGSILDRDQLLLEITHLISSRYGYEEVCVYLWDADAHALVLHATDGNSRELADSSENGAPKERECLPIAHASIPGRAFLRNRPVYLPNAQATYRFAADPARPEIRTRTAVPIRLGSHTTGVLDLRSLHSIQHTPIELNALQLLADQLGIGLENSRLYAEALSARAAAERADSLKTRLLTNISHELRTPLNAILGYSQAGLSEPNPYGAPLPESLLSDLQRVQRAGRQLVQLVDDLLSLSQAEIGALEVLPEEIDMAPLLENLFDEFAAMQRGAPAESKLEEVAWRLLLPADLPRIMGDPVRLRQLFLDVLSNARKYTVRGYIEVGAVVEANDVHFWVADTGTGIAWEQQAQIQQAFLGGADPMGERVQPRSGLGLGLSVANHIARLHGGSIAVVSAPGHGTVCHINLPLRSDLGVSATGSAAPERTSSVQSGEMPDSIEQVLQGVLANASAMTRQIADYLVANLAVTITREEIAAALRVSPDYVSRIFRKETGMTPWQYLNRYRVLQAQRLLLTTNLSITEIATATGFSEAAYFVRVFHRETGKAPQRFRKEAAAATSDSSPDHHNV